MGLLRGQRRQCHYIHPHTTWWERRDGRKMDRHKGERTRKEQREEVPDREKQNEREVRKLQLVWSDVLLSIHYPLIIIYTFHTHSREASMTFLTRIACVHACASACVWIFTCVILAWQNKSILWHGWALIVVLCPCVLKVRVWTYLQNDCIWHYSMSGFCSWGNINIIIQFALIRLTTGTALKKTYKVTQRNSSRQ